MRRGSWSVVAMVVVLGTSACGSEMHRVGGTVRGIWSGADGVALRLQADGVDTLLVVPSDGDFHFEHELPPGASYTVTVAANPVMHACAVDAGGNGVIADADVTTVSIACVGPPVNISFSGHAEWVFDPTQNTQQFDASPFAENVAFTVTGSVLTARVNDTPVVLGIPTAPIALPAGSSVLILELTARGGLSKAYGLEFDRGAGSAMQIVYGKPSTTGPRRGFGAAVALDQDTLAVGAPGEISSGVGAVYVFTRAGDTWTQQARLALPSTSSGTFGSSLALMGNLLAVGVPDDSSGAPESGAVHVFTRNGTTWIEAPPLKAPNADAMDRFGTSVALYGDLLAVGAPFEASRATGINGDQFNNDAPGAGAVYVFSCVPFCRPLAYIKASNTDANDQFGASVALSSDTLAVGAPNEASAATGVNGDQASNQAPGSGAVYLFSYLLTFSQQAYVKASNTYGEDHFGSSVALSNSTLVVGAPGETGTAAGINGDPQLRGGVASGAAYVFFGNGIFGLPPTQKTWRQEAYIKASNPGAGDQFGVSVALAGDLLAVGAPGEASLTGDPADDHAPRAGAAYLFIRGKAGWTQSAYAKASNAEANDNFGQSVAVSTVMASGAPGESSGATGINPSDGQADNSDPGAGAIYLFR